MRYNLLGVVSAVMLFSFFPVSAHASSAANANTPSDETLIRRALDNWARAFHDKDINAIMSMYKPGSDLVVFDIVPPLRYSGYDAYKKDYIDFLVQYKGPINVEFRDMHIVSGGTVAYVYCLERLSGTLTNGQKSDMWLRVTSGFRKIKGRWFDMHDHMSVPTDLNSGKALTALTP